MLASLNIQNVILIEQITVTFKGGLCALTGETGAGKSILLDSLGLALGARSESGIVRKGADQASVTAVFELAPAHPVYDFLTAQGLGVETTEPLVFRRLVTTEGRSRAFINDQAVSAGLLKQAGEYLVEIHGQFETQGLLNPRTHRDLLDAYGVERALMADLRSTWQIWHEKDRAAQELQTRIETARQEEAFLRQSLEDLDTLSPQDGEEEQLTTLRERLMKRTQYFEALRSADHALGEAQKSMGLAWRALEKIGEMGQESMTGMDRAQAELQEVLGGIQSLFADLEDSEQTLPDVDDRLFALKNMARKHGCSIAELPMKRDQFAQALNEIEHQDDLLQKFQHEAHLARKQYHDAAQKVSAARGIAGGTLDKLVQEELSPLKLDKARFETTIEPLPETEWGPFGMERVQFLVATNPNAPAGPIHKIASGGELARFMLALKVVLAEVGVTGTLVFDEVDSGIGGAVADAVGERLARLAGLKTVQQILVVTHSPQVAAKAAHHFVVQKNTQGDVRTHIIALPSLAERQEEIARMLSGALITTEARAAAAKLLEGRADV